MLAVLTAALPSLMAKHAGFEVDALLRAMMPGLSYEAELRVHSHPGLADTIRETLIDCLPADGATFSVVADAHLAMGDILISWQDGSAKRDCHVIWNEIRSALSLLGLPSLEEICRGE